MWCDWVSWATEAHIGTFGASPDLFHGEAHFFAGLNGSNNLLTLMVRLRLRVCLDWNLELSFRIPHLGMIDAFRNPHHYLIQPQVCLGFRVCLDFHTFQTLQYRIYHDSISYFNYNVWQSNKSNPCIYISFIFPYDVKIKYVITCTIIKRWSLCLNYVCVFFYIKNKIKILI